MRECGVLMPVFSLPSAYGIGCFSKEAYEFADMLKGTDAESTFENIKVFEEKFNKALESAINERLKRNVPKVPSSASNSNANPYSRKSWSLTKQMELERDNPQLAQELKQQANN